MLLYCLHTSDLESRNLIFIHAKGNFSTQTEPIRDESSCNTGDESAAAEGCGDAATTSLLSGTWREKGR